jgi:hypothetical protein
MINPMGQMGQLGQMGQMAHLGQMGQMAQMGQMGQMPFQILSQGNPNNPAMGVYPLMQNQQK